MTIPVAQILQLKTKTVAICPKCNTYVPFRARKKDKSYSGIEYRKHYTREHSGA